MSPDNQRTGGRQWPLEGRWVKSIPLAILVLSLGVTCLSGRTIRNGFRQTAHATYTRRTPEIANRIAEGLYGHEGALFGGAGLFHARDEGVTAIAGGLHLNNGGAWAILLGGMACSVVLSWIAATRWSTRKKAVTRAGRMTADLRESEERFRAMADSALGPIRVSGPDNRCVWFNRGWLDFTGRAMELESGDGWSQGVHPEDKAKVLAAIAGACEARQPFHVEYRLRRADGEYRWLLDRGVPRMDERDDFAGYIGSCIDITDRKRLEDEMGLAVFTMDNMEDAVYWASPDASIWRVNGAACRMLGYTTEELTKLRIPDIDPTLPAEAWSATWDAVKKEVSTRLQTVHRAKDGRDMPVEITSKYLEFGGREFLCATVRDISERQRYEAELVRAREAADSANRAKSEFMANMSHEIRTPMNGIVGMVELLLDAGLDSRQRRFAVVVRDSASSLLGIVDDILDWSKIEAGKLELESVDFDLRPLMESIADLFAAKTQEKGIELNCLVEPDVPTRVRGDPGRLRQVVMNLVGNAVRFTETGDISMRVKVGAHGDPVTLRFEVADTGIGVAAAQSHLLFRPFSQADSSTTRRFGGTGLGLSIVHRLVTMMGGSVDFESREGRGSTFWCTVPFDLEAGVARPNKLSLRGRRVLVVGRSPAGRRHLRELLEFWKCDIEEVPDLETAIARTRAAAATTFEAAMVDLEIAEMENAFPAARLRHPELAAVPAIAIVPIGSAGEAERWRSLGFVARVAKPVKEGELGTCLAAVLGRGERPRPSGPEKAAVSLAQRSRRADSRLLLVEDNEINQEVAVAMLQVLGYVSVEVVADGRLALDALARADFDVVLMDCQLPVLDGYEASRQIRQLATPVRNHKVPIVAMTANALPGDRAKCLEAEMDDYIAKPIRIDVLERVLEKWLDAAGGAPAADGKAAQPTEPAATAPAFEREDLIERLMDNEDLARRVVSRFLSGMPQQLAALSNAVSRSDRASVHLAAHSIKGAAANAGGCQLCDTASQIEMLGKSGDFAGAGKLLPDMAAHLDRFRSETAGFREPAG